MTNPNRSLSVNFNMLLTPELDARLIDLATTHGISKAHIIRQAITNWASMETDQTPLCADGQKCRCPHAHIYTTRPAA